MLGQASKAHCWKAVGDKNGNQPVSSTFMYRPTARVVAEASDRPASCAMLGSVTRSHWDLA